MSTPERDCGDLEFYHDVAGGKVSVDREQTADGYDHYVKRFSFQQGSSDNRFGGYVVDDGVMHLWAYGPQEWDRLYAFKFFLGDQRRYYWLDGNAGCMGEAGFFLDFAQLTEVRTVIKVRRIGLVSLAVQGCVLAGRRLICAAYISGRRLRARHRPFVFSCPPPPYLNYLLLASSLVSQSV